MAKIVDELLSLNKQLQKALNDDNEMSCADILNVLSDMNGITIDALLKTKVGYTVKDIKNKYKGNESSTKAKDLMDKWKKILEEQKQTKTKETKETKESIVKEPKKQFKMKEPRRDTETDEMIFDDHPEFRPNLTPMEVLQLGSFGGTYFRPIKSSVTNKVYNSTEVLKETVPDEWLEGLNLKRMIVSPSYTNGVNKYKVHCGGDLAMWEGSGWIQECDPYGWFQWYCRFYQGRRCYDDQRQIARGNACFGPKGRWRSNLINKVLQRHPKNLQKGLDDFTVSPVIRQTLQHWGYQLKLKDLEAALRR